MRSRRESRDEEAAVVGGGGGGGRANVEVVVRVRPMLAPERA
eukprot:COSAG06_NODE_15648_length_1055_cov_1.284519_1_plen_41_part_10